MICFVLVAFIVMKLEKIHKNLWTMLYTHTHTHTHIFDISIFPNPKHVIFFKFFV